jgi:hypothetical protein
MSTRAEPAAYPSSRGRGEALGARLRNPAILCLIAAVAASGVTVLLLAGDVVFLRDEWPVVLERRGFSAGVFLDPHVGHLAAGVIAIYKLLLATFGMTSPLPFHVASTLIYLAAAVTLFVYARRRVGDWLALMASVLILFFGAGAVDMLSPFQMFFSGSIAAGIGALLALDRDDRLGDVIACVLLIVAISFSEAGIAFTIGVLVRLALSDRPLANRLYVGAAPLVLYAIWWLGWGHTATSHFTLHNVASSPTYILDAASAAIASLLGLASASDALPAPSGQAWVPAAFIVALGLAAWRIGTLRRVPRGVWPVLAIGLTFWALAAFNTFFGRAPGNGRYIYPSAVFVLLIAVELCRGVRLGRRGLAAAAAVMVVGVAANIVFLRDGYWYYFRPANEQQRGALSALEIAGPQNPMFVLNAKTSPVTFFDINTGQYLSAVKAFGSPAYTPEELVSAPQASQLETDKVLGAMLGLRLEPGGAGGGPCRTVRATTTGDTGLELGPGRVGLRASEEARAKVELGRFSDQLPLVAGSLAPGSRASLTIPADESDRPWRLGLVGHGPVAVCLADSRGGGAE